MESAPGHLGSNGCVLIKLFISRNTRKGQLQIGPDWPRLVPGRPDWPQEAQIGPDWSQEAQIGPDWPQEPQTGPDWTQEAQIGSDCSRKPFKVPRIMAVAILLVVAQI